MIVGHINEWISMFLWYQRLKIPAWYWYCWVPWLVWNMCIHDIEIGMRQVYIHEWYYLRPFLSLYWYKASFASSHMSLGRAFDNNTWCYIPDQLGPRANERWGVEAWGASDWKMRLRVGSRKFLWCPWCYHEGIGRRVMKAMAFL